MANKTCTCGGKFLDAEDWRDHMPCPGTPVEQAEERAKRAEAVVEKAALFVRRVSLRHDTPPRWAAEARRLADELDAIATSRT